MSMIDFMKLPLQFIQLIVNSKIKKSNSLIHSDSHALILTELFEYVTVQVKGMIFFLNKSHRLDIYLSVNMI